MPETPYDLVLRAARDLPRVATALDAEMLGAALLGSVYALAEGHRTATVHSFVAGFLVHTARRRTDAARAIRGVFASLVPEAAGAARVPPGSSPWSGQLGKVRLVGSWAYGDVYGDQTSYLATFAYQDEDLGGPEHAVVVLIDHNIGIVKDVFVGRPADRIVEEVSKAAESDELVWLSEVDPALLRSRVSSYLDITDSLTALPEEGSLATDRMLVGARLASLPDGGPTVEPRAPEDPAPLVQSFLDSPHGRGLDRSTPDGEAAVDYAIRLILDFAHDAPDSDPLRWSPAVAGLFLLDWVHRRAVLDDHDVATLPGVVRAWAAWAAERTGLPEPAAVATAETIDTMTPEFVRLCGTGERRSTAATAMSQLLEQGVDPTDEAAVTEWLGSHSDNGNGPTIPHPR